MDFIEALKGAVKEVACGILGVQNAAVDFVGGIMGGDLGLYPSIVRSLRRSVCGNPASQVTVPQNQCPTGCAGVWTVNFTASYSDCNPGAQSGLPSNPFVSSFTINGHENQVPELAFVPSTVRPGCQRSFIRDSCTGDEMGTISQGFEVSVQSITFAKNDVNCTSPPINTNPSLPVYVPTPVNKPITYDGPSGPVTENVDISIGVPILIAPVTILAKVLITGNNFNLVGELTLAPEFKLEITPQLDINFGGHSDNNLPPGQDQPPDDGTTPSGRVIIGALVVATDSRGGRATVLAQGSNPDIFAPRLGNVSFLIATNKGRGWTNDIPVKNTRCYVPCPVEFGAVDVKGTAEPGYAFTVTPIYNRPNMVST